MKKILKNLTALTLGLSLVAITSCSGNDDPIPSMNGTYAGEISAEITGFVDDTFIQDFTITGDDQVAKLAITLNIPMAGIGTIPLPINVNLISQKTVTNRAIGDDVTVTGVFFKMEDKTITIPSMGAFPGATIVLKGVEDEESPVIDGVTYHGFQGDFTDSDESLNNIFMLSIEGTASGLAPVALPVSIEVYGLKK